MPILSTSQINHLKRYIYCKYHGIFPYYTLPPKQSKLLANKGIIHREYASDLTLTAYGFEMLKNYIDEEYLEILEQGKFKGLF